MMRMRLSSSSASLNTPFFFKTVHQGDIERIGHGFGGFPGNGVGIGIQDMSPPVCVKGVMTGTILRTRSAVAYR